ncbi:DUF4126 domain-containing protein [Cryptosporangium aurantiacum]|uniref:DUF4126 domain-containing protein n=1 Tax=Cryptosporangium aurantiacum TaxID=134849 RepID=A0A1M7HBG8_9ACTN|nr:DUF4126 domain-containing protein [Cryptosporangium aurantiacum]SHM25770.1 protein of unknown function [Cryptosporangium aurantiacum]
MFELLTGTGLAASSGLNAYIPLLTLGVLSRYTDTVSLPAGWQWLDSGWALVILAALLAVEMIADKVPIVDSLNDVVQTVVRPTAGGLAFGATATSDAVTVSDPDSFVSGGQWVPIAVGVVLALVVHAAKATARPALNTASGGTAAPVVSVFEDAASLSLSLLALLAPILVIVALAAMVGFFWWAARKVRARRRRKAESRARKNPLSQSAAIPTRKSLR